MSAPAVPIDSRRRIGPFALWIGFLLAVMAIGFGAWVYQLANGLAVTNMRNMVMWGQYILFFMFFVGLSAGGLIVASSGKLFGVQRFTPIVRLAVLEATVAVMLAALFLLPDIGRPERLWHVLRYPNVTSPMVWDFTIVAAYFVLSAAYVWLYTRADLAASGSPLALGTRDTPESRARDERWTIERLERGRRFVLLDQVRRCGVLTEGNVTVVSANCIAASR